MPSADFCTAVRDPYGSLSPYRTRCRSPGVSLTAFTAHLPNLQPGLIVDTGLRGSGPARPTQTASYSVPVRQVAALLPRFLQTAPRGHRPCASLALCLHQTWAEDLHLRAVKHARHTRRRGRTDLAHRALENTARFPRAPTGPFPITSTPNENPEKHRSLGLLEPLQPISDPHELQESPMLRPSFPRLSHPRLAQAIPSIACIAQVYLGGTRGCHPRSRR